eukprot:TRINITY_DN0_c1170_g1_i1.p1 TRINITY_DN0_c1170_g1~~TRINITY_DN0_c1170_g1_i1.p1  ORF type:complete len:221 (+),score=95.86 TRINITY_DN0_c1170_g1_i1:3-665(+)
MCIRDRPAGAQPPAGDQPPAADPAAQPPAGEQPPANATQPAPTLFADMESRLAEINKLQYFKDLAEIAALNPVMALAELTTALNAKVARRIIQKLREIQDLLRQALEKDKAVKVRSEELYEQTVSRLNQLKTDVSLSLEILQSKLKTLKRQHTEEDLAMASNQKIYDQSTASQKSLEDLLIARQNSFKDARATRAKELEIVEKAIQILRVKESDIKANTN